MRLNSSELKNKIQLGKDLSRAKEYKKAEDLFLEVLKSHPLADVYNSLGLCYADQGEFSAAEYCFQQALKINPNYMEAALNLSVIYNNLGMGSKSKGIYKKLKKYGAAGRGAMDPLLMSKIANLYGEIGDLFNAVGEYKNAICAYESAVDLCPNYIDLQTKLATAYRESGLKTKALKIFTAVKSRASNFAPYWLALGVTHYASNQPTKAKAAWRKALQLDPKNRSARAYLQLELSEKIKTPLKKVSKRKVSKKKVSKKKKK